MPARKPPLLEVHIKRKQFEPFRPVLQEVAFSIPPRSFTTLLGPTGCGKSTLLRAISGLDVAYDGVVRLQGDSVRAPTKACGIMFQEHRLLPWLTVADNVLFGAEQKTTAIANELLQLLGLEGWENAFPRQLSGGMAQRVAMARALVNLPDLLLLDEPFASLDFLTRHRLHDYLLGLVGEKNTTTLMVTHDVEEAVYLSDRILVMGPKPASIVQTHDVSLPRPRNRADPAFLALVAKIAAGMKRALGGQ